MKWIVVLHTAHWVLKVFVTREMFVAARVIEVQNPIRVNTRPVLKHAEFRKIALVIAQMDLYLFVLINMVHVHVLKKVMIQKLALRRIVSATVEAMPTVKDTVLEQTLQLVSTLCTSVSVKMDSGIWTDCFPTLLIRKLS